MMRRALLMAVAATLAAVMVMLQAGSSSSTHQASACSGDQHRAIWCTPTGHDPVP